VLSSVLIMLCRGTISHGLLLSGWVRGTRHVHAAGSLRSTLLTWLIIRVCYALNEQLPASFAGSADGAGLNYLMLGDTVVRASRLGKS